MWRKLLWVIALVTVLILIFILTRKSEEGLTIVLTTNAQGALVAVPEKARVSRYPDQTWEGNGNHVRWRNQTNANRSVIFSPSEWLALFAEPHPGDLVVAPGAVTVWYTVREDAARVERPYGVPGIEPPGEPVITAGP